MAFSAGKIRVVAHHSSSVKEENYLRVTRCLEEEIRLSWNKWMRSQFFCALRPACWHSTFDIRVAYNDVLFTTCMNIIIGCQILSRMFGLVFRTISLEKHDVQLPSVSHYWENQTATTILIADNSCVSIEFLCASLMKYTYYMFMYTKWNIICIHRRISNFIVVKWSVVVSSIMYHVSCRL